MKIVDLKCPSCGGKLAPMEGNPKIVVCEYCNSQFVLEEDQVINYHIHQYDSAPKTAPRGPEPIPQSQPSSIGAVLGIAAAVILGALAFSGTFLLRSSTTKSDEKWETEIGGNYRYSDFEEMLEEDEEEVRTKGGSALYEAMTKSMFQKSSDLVTAQDLEKVTYIKVQNGRETSKVWYSFDDPYDSEAFKAASLELEALEWDTSDLARFPNLVKVDLTDGWPGEEVLKKMEYLKGIVCSNMELSEIAAKVEPTQIMELEISGAESLEGLSAFENLQILTLINVPQPDIRQITPLKNLKSLSIEEDDSTDLFGDSSKQRTLTDYSGLSVLSGLETLHLQSSSLREFSFLKPLVNLTELSIEDSEAISVEPLGELGQLTSLRLVDNASVQDYNPIGRLGSLKSLTIDKSTSQDDPDLSSLGELEYLDMSGFMSVAGVKNLTSLKELGLHGCNIDEIKALSALTGLESFTCYSVWTYAVPLKNVNFLDGMTNLKRVDFCGGRLGNSWGGFQKNMEILGDISNVLNHEGLEELYLNQCMFEIGFDKIKENPSLRILEMKEVSLKENFYVETSGGFTNLWYDDVTLEGHTDFLTRFPNLEELYLDGNQLTDIQFAASLKSLTHLGLNNNYVTDLSPLNQAESLEFLDIRQNPVTSVETREGVTILK